MLLVCGIGNAKDNEVMAYITPGSSTAYNGYCSFSGIYTRHLTDKLDVYGGLSFSTKRKHFFSSIAAHAKYRFHLYKSRNLYVMTGVNYTDYGEFHLNEYVWRIAAKFESTYFDFELGNCLFAYTSYGSHKTEAFTPSINMVLRFRKLTAPWTVGVFLRNFDDFYYDNYNVNWGINGRMTINPKLTLMGELAVRPAGTMSQLATKYDAYLKLGAIYKW